MIWLKLELIKYLLEEYLINVKIWNFGVVKDFVMGLFKLVKIRELWVFITTTKMIYDDSYSLSRIKCVTVIYRDRSVSHGKSFYDSFW